MRYSHLGRTCIPINALERVVISLNLSVIWMGEEGGNKSTPAQGEDVPGRNSSPNCIISTTASSDAGYLETECLMWEASQIPSKQEV